MRSIEREEEKKLFSGLVEANKAYIKIPKGFGFWWRYFTSFGECMISKWFYLVLQVWNFWNLFDKEGFNSVRKYSFFKCVEINLKAPVPWYGGWESLIDICGSPLPSPYTILPSKYCCSPSKKIALCGLCSTCIYNFATNKLIFWGSHCCLYDMHSLNNEFHL